MQISGLAWREENRSFEFTLSACVAIVSHWLVNLLVATAQQYSQVQIFMLFFAIRSERTMYLLFGGVPGVMKSDVMDQWEVSIKWVEIMDQWEVSRSGIIFCLPEDFYLFCDCIQGGFIW